jgi:hypothetical protein
MEQIVKQLQPHSLTFRGLMDRIIVLGGVSALVLSMIFWVMATAFTSAGIFPTILALLITLLLSLIGIILIVRYVDIGMINFKQYMTDPFGNNAEQYMYIAMGAGIICLFLAISIVVCISQAGVLEGWRYTFFGAAVLLVGYQTWRVLLGGQRP